MAFRYYEMNMILRVQDRATTRIRRVASDLGGVNRAAQLQRKMAQLQASQAAASLRTSRLRSQIDSTTLQTGEKYLGQRAQLNTLEAQLLTRQARLNKLGMSNVKVLENGQIQARNSLGQFMTLSSRQKVAALQYAATQDRITRSNTIHTSQIARLNSELASSVALEKALATETAQVAAEQAIVNKKAALQQRGRILTHAGSIAGFAGLIGLGTLGFAAGAYANFNRESVKAATQLRGTNESFVQTVKIANVLQSGILDLTRTFPASAAEMAQSAYQIASGMDFAGNSVQRFNSTFRLLRAANRVAVAGFTDLNSATETLITIFNNFDPEVRNVNGILNTLFAIVRFGRGDFTQFAELFGGVAAAARGAGQSLIESGSALAFLTTRLPRPQASAGLQRLFQIMGTKDFQVGFKAIFGVPATIKVGGVEKLKDLSEIIETIIVRTTGLPKDISNLTQAQIDRLIVEGGKLTKGGVELQNLIQTLTAAGQNVRKGTTGAVGQQGTIQARRALVNLIVGWKQYRDILQNVTGDVHEFDRSFQAASKSPGIRWQIAINQFKAFAIVVGQQVLPVLVRFVSWLTTLAHHFENLSPGTKRLIGAFAAWSAIGLTLGGTLALLIGSFTILSTLIGAGGAGLTGRAAGLYRVFTGLAALGVIKIGIELVKSGDQSAWKLALGSLAQVGGAAFIGSKIAGWPGAVVAAGFAAYSIPLQMANAELQKQGFISEKTIQSQLARIKKFQDSYAKVVGPTKAAAAGEKAREVLVVAVYKQQGLEGIKKTEQFMKTTLKNTQQEFVDYIKSGKASHFFVMAHQDAMRQVTQDNSKATKTVLQDWQDLAQQLSGIDVYGSLTKQAAQMVTATQLNLALAQAAGNQPAIEKALKAQIAQDEKRLIPLKKLYAQGNLSAAQSKELYQLAQNEAQARSALTSMTNAATNAQTTYNNQLDAANTRLENAKNRVDQLKTSIQSLRQDAIQKLQSAFGTLFSGPITQGPIVQMFNNINTQLEGFGAKPIPIPVTLTLQDQAAQQRNFNMLTNDIALFAKRVPKQFRVEFINEILGMGPSALPFLEGVRRGTKAQQNLFIRNFVSAQRTIKAASQSPWNIELQAANIQLRAAKMQLQVAQGKVTKAQEKVTSVQKNTSQTKTTTTVKPPPKPPQPTRTTQSIVNHNYNEQNTIHADGATPHAVKRALDSASFAKRTRRKR